MGPYGLACLHGTPPKWQMRILDNLLLAKFIDRPLQWWNEFWLPTFGQVGEGKANGKDLLTPSKSQIALGKIALRCPNVKIITTEVDGLQRRTEVPRSQLIEINGVTNMYRTYTHGELPFTEVSPSDVALELTQVHKAVPHNHT